MLSVRRASIFISTSNLTNIAINILTFEQMKPYQPDCYNHSVAIFTGEKIMKICVLSCSPKGENSLGLQSAKFLQQFYPDDVFDIHFTTKLDCPDEVVDAAADADLILILSSIFHLNVHGQMMSMLDQLSAKLKAKLGDGIDKKYFAYMTSSNFLYDIGAHKYVTHWARSEKLNFLRLLSLKDESLLTEQGREELYRWFAYTKDTIELLRNGGVPQVTEKRKVSILNDHLPEASVNRVKSLYEERGCEVDVVNLSEYDVKPCNACFACYSNRTCCMKDDVPAIADRLGTNTDLMLTMGTLKRGMLSQKFKFWTDRHVQFGRAGTSDEFVRMTLVESDEEPLERQQSMTEFAQWEEAINGIGRDYGAGTYFMRTGDEEIDITRYVDDTILIMNNELVGPRNVFSECLNTRFAELAHLLQFMVPLDYAHFKKDGYYKPMPINTNVRYVNDVKGGIMSCKMRLSAYDMARAEVGSTPKLTKRRTKYKGMSYLEHLRKGDAEDSGSKGGFLGLFGKKK